MELGVGKVVVYRGHGAGCVVARETRESADGHAEMVVLELGASLTVTLPVSLARERLRPLANEVDLESVQRTLRATAPATDLVWLKRHKATREKVTVGETIGLAEVVSDGARRCDGQAMRLSVSERELYLKARRLLADEIGLARGIDSSAADEWITDQLSHAPR